MLELLGCNIQGRYLPPSVSVLCMEGVVGVIGTPGILVVSGVVGLNVWEINEVVFKI